MPAGEVYQAIESPRGELGYYVVSDGTAKPYRVHMRAPSFANLQAAAHDGEGTLIADVVAASAAWILCSGDDRPLMAFSPNSKPASTEADEAAIRRDASARPWFPCCSTRRTRSGYVSEEADRRGRAAGRAAAAASGQSDQLLLDAAHASRRANTTCRSARISAACCAAATELWEHALQEARHRHTRSHAPTGSSRSKKWSASEPAVGRRRCR